MPNFWTALAAVAALLSAVIAAAYTWLTFRLVVAQAEPKVVLYACSDPLRQTIIMLRIANIGRDVASDIRFVSSRPVPARAFGLTTADPHMADVMRDGPLVDGIPVLGPGDTREVTWGQFGGLMKALGQEPIDVRFTYNHGRRKLSGYSRLEVASFTGTDDSENPVSRMAEDLKKVAKSLQEIEKDLRRPYADKQLRAYNWRKTLERLPETPPEDQKRD